MRFCCLKTRIFHVASLLTIVSHPSTYKLSAWLLSVLHEMLIILIRFIVIAR